MTIPGLDPSLAEWFNYEARRVVEAAIAQGVSLSRVVLRIAPEGVTAELRSELADFYEQAGVRVLARKIRNALVPAHSVLVMVDAECTHITTVRLSVLLGDRPATPARTYAP